MLYVAVTLCVPAVFRVALKLPDPLVRVAPGGRTACGSLLEIRAVPEWAVVVFP
jgi:hypothetical protein